MRGFEFACNTEIYFGTGIWEEALRKITEQLKGNVLIVTTGRSLIRYGYLNKLTDCLNSINGVRKIAVFDGISQNPRLEEVVCAVQKGKEIEADVVIGFGGGSAMDAAKAAAVGIPINADLQKLEEYLIQGKEPGKETLPIIAIPTTAGTGSELSKGAILLSKRHQIKSGIRGKNVIPKIAIVDAEFTWTVPEKITMETGFDVLAHAVESYVAQKSNLFSEMLSERAIEITGRCLKILKENPEDHAAREEMSYASMIMGFNLANVGTCLPHRMQYPVGTATDTSHGAGLAALYPSWMEYEAEVNHDKITRVLELLQLPKKSSISEEIRTFQRELRIDYSLKRLGVKKEMVKQLTAQVTGNLQNDKLYSREDILLRIMEASF